MEKIMNELLNMTLTDMLRECEALGIDTIEHSETIEEMYEDGILTRSKKWSRLSKTVTTTHTSHHSRRNSWQLIETRS